MSSLRKHCHVRPLGKSTLALCLTAAISGALYALPTQPSIAHAASDGAERIHVLTHTYSDCIILESNGLFGIVDSGEDNDYPDGSDPRYPFRDGITIGEGHEDEVINYLYSIGVTQDNLEFYIGTHPHSDHIGSADEIIREFHPKRVYTPAYDDSLIGARAMLWDNQYVYDNLVNAANELAIPLILNLDPAAPLIPTEYNPATDDETPDDDDTIIDFVPDDPNISATAVAAAANEIYLGGHVGNPIFDLGDFSIEIVNYGTDYQKLNSNSGNNFSWGVVAEAHGKRAFLGGDIDNTDGDETHLATTLGHVDLMKLNHHGLSSSNTAAFIEALSPAYAFQTGCRNHLWDETYTALTRLGTRLFSADVMARQGLNSLIAEFDTSGISINAMDGNLRYDVSDEPPYIYVHLDGRPYPLYGWNSFDGITYWFENSASPAQSCWLYNNDQWYWLDEFGERSTGITVIGNHTYIFDSDGVLFTDQWLDYEGDRYRVNEAGEVQFGWFALDGKSYYLDPSTGVMVTDPTTINNKTYYFFDDGSLRSGWIQENGNWHYYTGTSTKPETGWIDADGLTYYADKNGNRQVGWQAISGRWYHFDNAGVMSLGWKKIDGAWYYLDPQRNGAMLTGWYQVNNTWYYSNSSGVMQTGWAYINGAWYYLDPINGDMKTGWYVANGAWYYSHPSGAMATGWLNDGGTWYYLNGSGAMQTGWAYVNGAWYYLNASGAMQTGWVWVNNAWYYMNSSGAMLTGWQWIDGNWYYMNSSGAMLTGWQHINGVWYYLSRSGAWVE